jgi:DNA-binding transcriptional regulator YhcF (GntR family)
VRRPAPINAIASSLSLPYETVRRHIHGLIEDGFCVKVRGKGVIVPARVLESEENLMALRRSYEYLRNMIGILRRAGVDVGDIESVRETV